MSTGEREPRRAGILPRLTLGAVIFVAGAAGLAAGTGETAGELDLCPGTPAPTTPFNGETEFRGELPPGCETVQQWREELEKRQRSGQVIYIGEVPCVKITVGSDDPSPKPCGGQ